MALSLHNQKSVKNLKSKKRIGRGHGSGRGTYAGRGLKGQKARSGGRGGLKLLGMKGNMQNLPKLPGFKSLKPRMETVTLAALEKHYADGAKVTPENLLKKKLVLTTRNGVKVLGSGTLSKKLLVIADAVSAQAQVAIEKAGGTVKAKRAPKETAQEEQGA